VYDVGLVDGIDPFLAMEFLGGENLRARFIESKSDWKQVLSAYLDVAHGLAAAHAAGIVHRDIKPDNCVAADDGRFCVIDFGLVTTRSDAEEMDTTSVPSAPARSSPGWMQRFEFSIGLRRSPSNSAARRVDSQSSRTTKTHRVASTVDQLTH